MTEATVIKHVRFACVQRDGYCRLQRFLGFGRGSYCDGPSEWAHLGPWQRWRTMGKKNPEERHCTQGSLMLCKLHHNLYDGKYLMFKGHTPPLLIVPLTDRYADGPLVFVLNGVRYEEAA